MPGASIGSASLRNWRRGSSESHIARGLCGPIHGYSTLTVTAFLRVRGNMPPYIKVWLHNHRDAQYVQFLGMHAAL
jgi:hypothetical protein